MAGGHGADSSDRFSVGDAAEAVRRRDMFNIVDTQSGWKVEMAASEVLDHGCLRRWADRLAVGPLLDELWAEAAAAD